MSKEPKKEIYSIRTSDKQNLKEIPTAVVLDVLHMLCDVYSNGGHVSELFLYEVDKQYLKSEIQAHMEAIEKLEAQLLEVEECISEQKEVYQKEQRDMEDVWSVLYTAHFEQELIKSDYDISKIFNKSYVPNRDLIVYCIGQIRAVRSSPRPNPTLKRKVEHECDWLESKLKYLLSMDMLE